MLCQIPFIGRIDKKEKQNWIREINNRSTLFELVSLESTECSTAQSAEVAVVANPDPTALATLPHLKWIQSLWAGVEGLLTSSLDTRISIVRMTDPQMADSMAEAVLAWSLYIHRKMPHYYRQQLESNWRPLDLKLPQQCNISVFGLGKLGTRAALRLQQNQFTVRGFSTSKKQIDGIETFHGAAGLAQLLPKTDIAVILLPLTEETLALFNKQRLSALADGASIINFARGPVIVESDLINCLDDDLLDHAVLDVFDHEPLPANHALWSHPKVTVLPHISAPTTIATAAAITAANIDNYLKNGTIPQSVDREKGY